MRLYVGTDLHANNHVLGIVDEKGRRVFHKRIPNDKDSALAALEPFRAEVVEVAVESTFNWYWYVDLLMKEGYKVSLGSPPAFQQYKGKKHVGDKHDAFWLAEMLRLGILPRGYIYPKEERPLRDLLRTRGFLVQLRTCLLLSLKNVVIRNYGYPISTNEIKRERIDLWEAFVKGGPEQRMAMGVEKELIDSFGEKIREIERAVRGRMKAREAFKYLQTIPGVGDILAFTIVLEAGELKRFATVGDFVSYCRKTPTRWTSNGKTKGTGNKKNGNRYLAWAYSEAAEFARRYDERIRAFYNRKAAKTNSMVAHAAVASKLARASYVIMRDQVAFDLAKFFGRKAGWDREPAQGLAEP